MLYDPKWEKKTGDLTIPNLIAWLETQPRDRGYDCTDPTICLVAEFLKAHGVTDYVVPSLPDGIASIIMMNGTYGGALDGLRTQQAR